MAAVSSSETTTPASADQWAPEIEAYEATLERASSEAAQFIADMAAGKPGRWLSFIGRTGCGKTMLARQLFHQAQRHNPGGGSLWVDPTGRGRRRPRCVWVDSTKFSEAMMEGDYRLPEYLADDWLVVFDDLGASRDKTDFVADGLYRLCNSRLGKWTIFTANLTMAEISARTDERVASRLIRDENKVVAIKAGDYALRKRGAA